MTITSLEKGWSKVTGRVEVSHGSCRGAFADGDQIVAKPVGLASGLCNGPALSVTVTLNTTRYRRPERACTAPRPSLVAPRRGQPPKS
jgi:hypothetical protein